MKLSKEYQPASLKGLPILTPYHEKMNKEGMRLVRQILKYPMSYKAMKKQIQGSTEPQPQPKNSRGEGNNN